MTTSIRTKVIGFAAGLAVVFLTSAAFAQEEGVKNTAGESAGGGERRGRRVSSSSGSGEYTGATRSCARPCEPPESSSLRRDPSQS